MFASRFVRIWKLLSAARWAVLAGCLATVLFTSGCTSVMNRGDNSGGWLSPKPPDPPETVEDFMRLKRMDP